MNTGGLVGVAVLFVIWYYVTTRHQITTTKSKSKNTAGGGGTPPPIRKPEPSHALVSGDNGGRSVVSVWEDSWKFTGMNYGAFSFKVRKPGGGLLIGLASEPDEDIENGYAIVHDDGIERGNESWISKLPFIGAKFHGSKRAQHVPLANGTSYWVSVNNGFIAFGYGDVVGESVILTGLDGSMRYGVPVRYFGFGSYGVGGQDGYVYDIRIHEIPPEDLPAPETELMRVEYLSHRAARVHPKPHALTGPPANAVKYLSN